MRITDKNNNIKIMYVCGDNSKLDMALRYEGYGFDSRLDNIKNISFVIIA